MIPPNRRPRPDRPPALRWECRCTDPPILLARYDPGGRVQIKIRDRYYLASGCVHATCPRCGAQHVLDLRPATPPDPNRAPGAGPAPVPTSGGWWW